MQNDFTEIIKTVVRKCVQNKHIEKKEAVQITNVQMKTMYK